MDDRDEEERLRAVALRNANAVLIARQRAEEELAAERERLRVTLASIGDAVISTDAEGRITFLNGVAESLIGWSQAEAAGRPLPDVFRIVNERTRLAVENPALRALREGVVVGLANHTVLVARDGSERPIDDSAAPLRDASGTLIGAVLVFRDVTERRRAEQLLQLQKDMLELLVQGRPLGQVLETLARAMETHSRHKLVAAIHLLDESGDRFGLAIAPSLPAGYGEATRGMEIRTRTGPCCHAALDGESVVVTDVAGDSRWKAFADFAHPLGIRSGWSTPILSAAGRVVGTFANYYDEPREPSPEDLALVALLSRTVALAIEHDQANRARARLAAIVESSTDAIISKDLDGVLTSWNAGAERIFGYAAGEAIGRPVTMLIPPELLAEEVQILERLRRGESIEFYETVRVTKDGRRIDVSLSISPIRDSGGRIVGASKISRDITARKLAEQRLALQHKATHALAESASLHEAASKILPAICEHLGWQVGALWYVDDQAEVLRCADLYHPSSVQIPRFEVASRQRAFERGVGLPGRVWADGKAVWIRDVVKDSNFPRAPIADAEGLHGAFALPIILNDEVLGVLEFFSREVRHPDPDLLEVMTAVGSQIGQFIERRRAEEALRDSEARYRSLVGLLPVGVYSCEAPSGVITFYNPQAAELWGRAPQVGETDERFCGSFRLWRPDGTLLPHDQTPMAQAIREGRAFRNEDVVIERPDGSRINVLVNIDPVRDAAGRVVGAVNAFHDTTALKSAQEALRESESRLRLAQGVARVGTFDWNIQTGVNRWTPELEAIYGLGSGEFAGTQQAFERLVHPDDRPATVAKVEQAIRTGEPTEHEWRVVRPRGGVRWVAGRFQCFKDPRGEPLRLSGVNIDITARVKVEQTTRFLADASAALAELTDYESTLQKVAALAVPFFADWCAVDMLEADGSIRRLAVTHTDPARVALAHELFRRYPPQPSDPRGVVKVLRTGETEWVPMITDEMLEASARDAEHLRIVRELGLRSYVCAPVKSRTRVLGALTFVTAESGRVYDADDLRAAEDLAHRAAVAVENATLLTALKEADRRKDEFLALLAHELRNPLAPIRNGLEAIRLAGPVPEPVTRARDRMDRQLGHMVRLVDDLLDVSRISRGKMELRKSRVRLADVVGSAVETARPLVDAAGHELNVELPTEAVVLDADLTRLAQVFANLLTNSAKYTEKGGKIWLTAARAGREVVVAVRDTGIGIPTDMLGRIFDMFSQVDRSIEKSTGGLGIGLALVKGLVEMHGGTVAAESEGPGRGSTFTVRLPVATPETETPAAGPHGSARPTGGTSRRVLVVDDNRDGAESLAEMLLLMGHEVHTAHDGLEAVDAAGRFRPDLVLMDVGMPRLNGLDATRRIREEPWGECMTIIALTGWGQEGDRERSREAGCDGHLVKPVGLADLEKLLAGLKAGEAAPHA